MDKETFEILKKYNKQFQQIRESDFCRLPGSPSLKELDECYRNIFGKGSRLLYGCSSCVYASLTELSREYWKQVEVEKLNDNENFSKNEKVFLELETENKTEVIEKKKVGRPRKNKATDKE